ncbi:MAG: hypothetical protein EOP10_10965 [Proteobacteria bacterium]|nr:MAG: hypothetical protein EOP10_10965 [Pseudomonadota bacterium]
MIGNFLRGMQNNEWSHFMDYLSPVFFEVVPTLDIAKQTTQLGKTFAKLKHEGEELAVRQLIKTLRLPVNFREPRTSSEMLTSLSKQEKGRIALSLYFAQIMNLPFAWLDLRSGTFEYLSRECNWTPGAWIMRWDEKFISALRKIYKGHFTSDDSLYFEGLKELELDHAADAFRAHFGNLSKPTLFRLKDFRDSFHEIFLSCKESRTTLHPNFFALGLLLSSLYENLESLGVTIDVKKVFLANQLS